MPSKERRLGLRPSEVAGVLLPALFDSKFAIQVLERISEGETLKDICDDPSMPSRKTVYKWVNVYPEFATAFLAARELSAMAFEEQALGLAKKLASAEKTIAGPLIRAYEVAMGQFRWSAARRDPKKFGQQQNTVLVVPIQINTTLDMGDGGFTAGNTPEFPDIYQLEAKLDRDEPLGVPEQDSSSEDTEGERSERTEGEEPPAPELDPFAQQPKRASRAPRIGVGRENLHTPKKRPVGRPRKRRLLSPDMYTRASDRRLKET